MHSTYLPLPCHTQFVESGVKEAKLAASTDRSEQHRSWIAIVWSKTPLTKSKVLSNVERILSLIKDASVRSKPHREWRRNQVNDEHDNRFKIVEASLSKGHFVQDRLEQKREKVEVVGSVFKKQNVAQSRAKPQHLTPAVTGLIPYSSLVNARNLNDYKIELMHRGVPEDEVQKA